MRVSISGIAGSPVINEEESREEWKEPVIPETPKQSNLRVYGDVEQIRSSIAFYALQLFQNAYVIIDKFTTSDDDEENNLNQNSSEHLKTNQNRSIVNIAVLTAVTCALIFTIVIFKKKLLKKVFYQIQSYVDIAVIGGLAGYVLSKASAKDSVFFMRDDSVESNNSRGLEMYDLYYLQLLSDKLFHEKSPRISLLAKCALHTLLLVFYLPSTSAKGYVPLITCSVQFIVIDFLKALVLCNKLEKNLSESQASQEIHDLEDIEEEQQQLQSMRRNDSNFPNMQGHNSLSNSHQTEGILVGLDHSVLPRPHRFSMSMSSKAIFEGSKNLLGMFDDPLRVRNMKRLLASQKEQEEKWKQYLNQIPLGVLLVKKSLDTVQFANDFMKQFFLRNFRKFTDKDILDAVMRQFQFKILSQVVNHSSSEKKRIAKFSLSAKKQVRESISNNVDKKQPKRTSNNSTKSNNINSINTNQLIPSNNVESKANSTTNFSHFQFSVKSNNDEIGGSFKSPNICPVSENKPIPDQPTMTLEQIIKNFDKTISSLSSLDNSMLEIYAKAVNFDNNESISLKGKVLYRAEGDEYLIIIEDITKYEFVTNLADRDDYKNRLISSFSHELRTPLNSSMGFLQTAILDSAISQNVKDTFLVPAYQSLRLQFFFINDILDFSQILAKRDLQLNFVTFHIQKLIQDIKELYDNSFDAKGISLQFVYDQKVKSQEICTDYDRLMQVLVNLLNNSLRYTLTGGVTIRINATSSNNLIFNVEDTGEGMNAEKFEQVKLKLQNFDQTGSAIQESQHTGFGLTISQIIVSILASEENSDLEVKNTEGGGCTFSFSIENIMNLQTSFSLTSYNTIKVDMIKTGVKLNRNGIKKHTYAPRNLERASNKGQQLSSHSLNARDKKRNNTVVVSNKIEDLTSNNKQFPTPQNFKASFFKKNQQADGNAENLAFGDSPMFPFLLHEKQAPTSAFKFDKNQTPGLTSIERKETNECGPGGDTLAYFTDKNNSEKISGNKDNLSLHTRAFEAEKSTKQTDGQAIGSFHHSTKHDTSKLTMRDGIQGKNIPLLGEDLQASNTYSQQKRFFATQSQALLQVNHRGQPAQKSLKTFDMITMDQDESYMLHEDDQTSFIRERIANYNFNYVLGQKEVQQQSQQNRKGSDHSTQQQNVSYDNMERHSQEHYSFFKSSNLHHVPMIQQTFKNALNDTNSNIINSSNQLKKTTPGKQPNTVKFRFPRQPSSVVENNLLEQQQQQGLIAQTVSNKMENPNGNIKSDKHSKNNKLVANKNSELNEQVVAAMNAAQPSADSLRVFDDNPESKDIKFCLPQPPAVIRQEVSPQLLSASQNKPYTKTNVLSNTNLTNNNNTTPKQTYPSFITPNNLKINELMNNIVFNQMQLSEQCSEFSWINNNNHNGINASNNNNNSYSNNNYANISNIEEKGNSNLYKTDFILDMHEDNISHINNELAHNPKLNSSIDPLSMNKSKSLLGSQHNLTNRIANLNTSHENRFLHKMQMNKDQQQFQEKFSAPIGDLDCPTIGGGANEVSVASIRRQKISRNSSWVRKNSLQFAEKEDKKSIEPEDEQYSKPHQKSQLLEPVNAPPLQQLLQKCQCRRMLCVDDEVFNLQVLFLLFKKLGYQIEKAFNGKDAIQVFTSFYAQLPKYQCESPNCTVFKAIILDCNMPVMNGWECAKQLRNLMSQKKLPSIPIIALTAYVTQQAYNQCKDSGMDEVMNKPISIEVLRDTVEQYILIYETDQKPTWV